jgi:hypothetical protein
MAVAWSVRAAGHIPDDMYITFRYAWNLAHGEGFVFNPGERVFGLTNPGHGLVLALLHAVTRVPVHTLAVAVFAAGLWVAVVLVWREGVRRGAGVETAIGGTLVLSASYLWVAAGSEAAPVLGLLAGSAVLAEHRPSGRWRSSRLDLLSGALAGLAVWYRPDAVIGVVALGVLLWVERRRPPWRWALAAAGAIGLGLVAARLWFGSFGPDTLEADRAMTRAREVAGIETSTGPIAFWSRATGVLNRHFGSGWLLLVGLGIAGLWPLFARGGRAARTLVAYGVGVAVGYPLLGVSFFHWYSVPPVAVLLLGAGALAGAFGQAAADAVFPRTESAGGRAGSDAGPPSALRVPLGVVAGALVLALPLATFVPRARLWLGSEARGGRYDTFRDAGIWIREHSEPDDRIAYGEIGQLAYWSRRPLDDLLGLVTPEAIPYVRVGDGVGAFLRRPPELFIDHPANPHPGIASRPWFVAGYQEVARIPQPHGSGPPAIVYRKRPDAELPPPREPWVPRHERGAGGGNRTPGRGGGGG